MGRLQLWTVILLLSVLHTTAAERPCPVCNGELQIRDNVADDRSRPSRNISVWNRSICGNGGRVTGSSPICTRCWFARMDGPAAETPHYWERSTTEPDSFTRPLSTAIREVPLPEARELRSLVVFRKQVGEGREKESVSYWCGYNPPFLAQLRLYARKHKLRIQIDDRLKKGDVYVLLEFEPEA